MSTDSTSHRGDYIREQREASIARLADTRVQAAFEIGHESLAEGDLERVREMLDEHIIPAVDVSPFDIYGDGRIGDIDPFTLSRLLGDQSVWDLGDTAVENGFEALYLVLSSKGQVQGDATTTVPAYEYRHQVGERYYRPLSAGSQPLEMANDGDWEATLFTGGQGSGKTSTRFAFNEDRLEAGHKVVDLVDLFKCENAMYDVESRHDKLDRIREEAGMDTGFDEYEPPEVSILLPLTHELADSQLPFDTEREEFSSKAFVIPASSLTYRQLVMLLPHTTPTQENYLRSAHQILSQQDRDWTLRDVAETVRNHTNASEAVADRLERALETAQSKSFIRDEASDHCIDWPDIMRDGGTVTSFSVYMIREKSDKLAITSWLLDSLYQARLDLLRQHEVDTYPPLTVNIGEAHAVAPRQKAEQDAEATIEGDMIDTMSELIALMRHVNMEILADTQKFKEQLSSSVSGLFHRVFAFSGQKPDIKKVFRTRVDDTDPAESVATYETGKCALVSGDGYSMPIKMFPPRMHHLDAKSDGDGLGARAEYLDHEELRPAPYDSTVPPRLRFRSLERGPVAEFVYQHVDETGNKDDYIVKQEFTDLFNDWTKSNGNTENSHKSVCKLIKRKTDFEDFRPLVDGKQRGAWKGIVVTYEAE